MFTNAAWKDTWLLLVLIDNKKISKALRNGLWSNFLQIKTTSVIDLGIKNAFFQLLAEFVCSLDTTITLSSLSSVVVIDRIHLSFIPHYRSSTRLVAQQLLYRNCCRWYYGTTMNGSMPDQLLWLYWLWIANNFRWETIPISVLTNYFLFQFAFNFQNNSPFSF